MEKFRRKNYFIDKQFQTRFIVKFCVIVIVSSVAIGFSIFYLSMGFTTVAIENAHVIVKSTSDFILPVIVETVVMATLFSAIAVIFLTLFTSHRIAGPLYRLKKDIEAFKNGDLTVNFRTRNTDQLKGLADSLVEMGTATGKKHLEIKAKLEELKNSMQSGAESKDAVMKKLCELESVISYFKT
ncbi:MAG: hypothetical protein PHI58_00110 [Candidatus Omnitrophica bacterium]|nr:hypothetical protein [Candidatus Omnitrophota bacterium]